MKNLLLALACSAAINVFGQNVGIGNSNPSSKLDVNGDLSLRDGGTITVTSNTIALPTTKNSIYRISSASVYSIKTITGGNDGMILMLINTGTGIMTITNATGNITTNVGSDLVGGSVTTVVTLLYNATLAKWVVTSAEGFGAPSATTSNTLGLSTSTLTSTVNGTAATQSLSGLPVGGDLSGTMSNATVAKINGATLGTTTATTNNLLVANGTQWQSVPMSGDASIDNTGKVTITGGGTGNGYIKNQTTQQTSANFNIAGNGSFSGASSQVTIGTSAATSGYQLTINTNATTGNGISMGLSAGSGYGINMSTASGSYNGFLFSNTSTATSSNYYGVGSVLSNAVTNAAGIVSGYQAYRATGGKSYGIYGVNGTISTYATDANAWAGFLQGRTVISGESAPTSGIGIDLEVRNTTSGAGNPATVSLRQTTSNNGGTGQTLLTAINMGDNNTTSPQAQIQAVRDATSSSATDLPTAITFSTTADNTTTLSERMRISNAGKVGISNPSPAYSMDFGTTDAIKVPTGTTLQRPSSPTAGATRFNSDNASLEYYDGTQWVPANTAQVPIGTITPYGASAAPSGWLVCDGSAVSRSTYASLFAVIGTTYGAGDGSTTFNLPDLRGKAAFGLSSSAPYNSLGATGGAIQYTPIISLGTLTVGIPSLSATLPNHLHTVPAHSHGFLLTTGSSTTGSESSHTHFINGQSFNTTDGAGAHQHNIGLRSNDNGYAAGNPNAFHYNMSSGGGGTSTTDRGQTTNANTGIILSAGSHNHTINVPGITSNAGSSHNHSIPSLSISGSIGTAGTSGDASFNSGNPTTLPTISTTATNATLAGSLSASSMNTNDPFQVVNYIIRATNSITSPAAAISVNITGGVLGQTFYYNGTTWTPTSNLYNNGTSVGIGTTGPNTTLDVNGSATIRGLTTAGIVTTTSGGLLSSVATVPNSNLTNSGALTVSAGTGLSGGGIVALGGSITLNNAGVTSVAAGTGIGTSASTGGITISNTGVTSVTSGSGISLSGSTGGVTINNTGVTSISAGTGITASSTTGGVTLSIGGSVLTTSNVSGTTGYYPKFTGSNTLGNSIVSDDGSTVSVRGRIYMQNGTLQNGTGAIVTSTSDLGLYSTTNGAWIRIVSNQAPIKFFTDNDGTANGGGTTEKFSILADGTLTMTKNASAGTWLLPDAFCVVIPANQGNVCPTNWTYKDLGWDTEDSGNADYGKDGKIAGDYGHSGSVYMHFCCRGSGW